MNALENYVSNITKVEKIVEPFGDVYKITADVNCYGNEEKQKTFLLNDFQWKQVQEKGYYMG